MFGAIAGGIASALAGGAMSKLFGGGQKAASGGIQGDVLATDNNTVGMGDAGIKSAIQGSNVPNPDEAVPSFRSEERFSRNAETDHVCRLLPEKKNRMLDTNTIMSMRCLLDELLYLIVSECNYHFYDFLSFFFNDQTLYDISTLSLHDALPIWWHSR